jgi:hypothetical protein
MAGTTGLEPATSDVTDRRSRAHISHTANATCLMGMVNIDGVLYTASEGVWFDIGKCRSKRRLREFDKCRLSVYHEFLSGNFHHLPVLFGPGTVGTSIVLSCGLNHLGSQPVIQKNLDLNPIEFGHIRNR